MTGAAVSNAPVCPCPAIAERVATFDWQRIAAGLDAAWLRCRELGALSAECKILAAELCRGRAVSQPHRDGAPRLRARRVQILRLSASRQWSPACALRCIHHCPASRTAGTRLWASTCAIRTSMPHFWSGVTAPGKPSRRRSSCTMARAITTACIRISMASMSSRCKSPSSSRCRDTTSRAVNSCS